MAEPKPDPSAIAAMKQHALDAFPKECCGFLMPDGYRPVENVHPDAEQAFRISDDDYLAAAGALAVVHSHAVKEAFDHRVHRPGLYPSCPSLHDMEGQLATALPWGIVVTDGETAANPFFWGDFVIDRPLLHRPFRHGVEDCYGAIRKWYWQVRQIKLPEFPRDPDWWTGDRDMYLEGFPKAGFRRLGEDEERQEGDVGLYRVGDRRVRCLNHGFVYLGDGTIYHHLPGRLSLREAAGGRLRQVTHWLRFEGLPEGGAAS